MASSLFALFLSLFLLTCGVIIYLLPTFIATFRSHKNLAGIFILNLFLGWTLFGWIAALIWSVAN